MLTQIVLFDGFDLLDVVAPYEVYNAAGRATDVAFEVELVTAEGGKIRTKWRYRA